MRLGPAGAEAPAVSTSDGVFDARSLTRDYDSEFFASDGPARLAGDVMELDIDGLGRQRQRVTAAPR
jgi:hypothetical protein